MNSGFKTRAKRIEEQSLIGVDRKDYERQRRHHYNLRVVTTAALMADVLSMIRQTEMPAWAREEFERPIPADAHKQQLIEADAWAQNIVGNRPLPEEDDQSIAEKITKLFHEHGLTGDLDTLDPQIEAMRDRELGIGHLCQSGSA